MVQPAESRKGLNLAFNWLTEFLQHDLLACPSRVRDWSCPRDNRSRQEDLSRLRYRSSRMITWSSKSRRQLDCLANHDGERRHPSSLASNFFLHFASAMIRLFPPGLAPRRLRANRTNRATIASAAPRANIHAVLEALSASHIFQGIVSAEDVRRGKFDPEVYLLAASRVGVAAERCIVVEDARAGIEGGCRAGMRGIVVSHNDRLVSQTK
jgi:FMN phosphatase YigB (HAD superfamily)